MTVMPDKISTAASYCTSGALACGGVVSTVAHDIQSWDWNTISLAGGFIIAIGTFAINWFYKRRQTRAYVKALKSGRITPPED